MTPAASSAPAPVAAAPPAQAPPPAAAGDAPKKKKICCACPDTKRARDECVVLNGEDACTLLVEAHKDCLRAEGFNV